MSLGILSKRCCIDVGRRSQGNCKRPQLGHIGPCHQGKAPLCGVARTFPQPTFCFFMQLALVHAAPSASAVLLPRRSLFILHGTSSHFLGAGQGLQPQLRTDLPASQEQAKGCFGLYHHHSKDENKVRLLSGYRVTHEKGKHQIPKSCIPRSLSF